jgi:hypothetical protein
MRPIYFLFKGGQPKDFLNTPHGHFAVGLKIGDADGNILLSPDCRTIGELREQAEYLKKLIDESVIEAEACLPP